MAGGHDNVRAMGGETFCYRATDATRCPGHHRCLALQVDHGGSLIAALLRRY
jgi:hypothetical protein